MSTTRSGGYIYTAADRERVQKLRRNGLNGRPLTWKEISQITRFPIGTLFELCHGSARRTQPQPQHQEN